MLQKRQLHSLNEPWAPDHLDCVAQPNDFPLRLRDD